MAPIQIRRGIAIEENELDLSFSRSGGPGGQHVNTSSTKVELRWDLDGTRALSGDQKARVRGALGSRVTREGVLVLQASEHRSQTRNREAVVGRFTNLLREALAPRTPRRRRSGPSRGARRRRMEAKRRRGETKRLRRPPEH